MTTFQLRTSSIHMAIKNTITSSKVNWDLAKWQTECPELTYRVVHENHPDFIPTGLASKFNSSFLAASGCRIEINNEYRDIYIGICIGNRVDKGFIDEQPYVSAFDKISNERLFDGYLQHGNWIGRTSPLTPWQLEAITASGILAHLSLERMPEFPSGNLTELSNSSILGSFHSSAGIMFDQMNDNSDGHWPAQ